ncbi:sodium/glucose cotransporter 4 [Strongylocentrotus purpuratus]|uniref:Sodium/glucose cotransporter 4 n=1 Tax=Strongylocentrotus purpuratus TaxID=7668 RepID=A0A7M7HKW4_STRPU|nr:sodium/glucose cotransporter 4 [Strongylocentrotus purpuratus]XP_780359.4 sodium/glucose cotransporter 4 [Strongylocentrotus purpuratus]
MGNLIANGKLEVWDIVVIVVHFTAVFSIGIWASWGGGKDSTSGYFLAGRQMPWYLVGLSLVVTNIGSSTFIGVSGTASLSGYGVVIYEFQALNCLLLLGFIFVPVYFASEVSTVPEYLKLRFGADRLQIFISIINLIMAIVIMLSGEMYAGSLVIQQSLGWDVYTSVIVLLLLTAVYTVAGGLKAVIYTDAIQAVVMMIGAFILMGIAFAEIDWSLETLRLRFMSAIPNTTQVYGNTSCGVPTEETWHIFRDAKTSDLPWPGSIFGTLVLGGYFWCTNQVIVQRTLAARNVTHSKAACIMTGYFKILPMFLMVIPGMISRTLWPDEIACVDPEVCEAACGNPAGCSNIAYPRLVVELMPTGLRGLMLATMLAAMISSLTSIFNASSSMFVIDIWYKIRPRSTELELVIVGKLATLVLVAVGVLWIPVIQAYGSGELFVYMQAILSYLTPAVFSVFTAAIAWTRINETGAFWGLVCGFIVGFTRFILDFVYGVPSCGQEDSRPDIVRDFHFLHFAAFLYGFTIILIVIFSLLTEPIPQQKLVRLTFWTRFSNLPRLPMSEEKAEDERKNDVIRAEKKKQAAIRAQERTGLKWKAWNILCGISGAPTDEGTEDVEELEAPEQERKATALENPKWARIALVNGGILGTVCVFILAYFG